ncbi:MAG: 4,5-dihydroxyphthalate decarboxylase [Hyphomicrobiales bacterium]|nr:4,5-dihydroxyphthalate decarboxylase [Hyphomicrobiales bacterium]
MSNNELALTLAISPYDVMADLTAGRVVAEGIKLTSLVDMPVEEIFYRFIVHKEWDISEISFAKYVSMRSQGDETFIALPVFPSRIFRHASIFVRRDGPVRSPADLVGRRVGLPEWAQTAAVYSRGLLVHQYGLDLASIQWVQAGVNRPGRIEKVEVRLPPGVGLTRRSEATLSDMLVAGEVDAVMSARAPECFDRGHPNIRRLFENFMEVETAYYKATSIFPIMHTVAIRGEVLARNPWIASNLYKAFEESRRRSIARALDDTHPQFPIPWGFEHARRAKATFGDDYWPYGIEPNRKTLEAFLQFAHEQDVCHRLLRVEELFPKQLLSSYRV